jgi:hypothetical protein
MAGLPHYRNSRTSINNFEPLYMAHFEVILTPPAALQSGFDLVMENVLTVGGLETNRMPTVIEQKYKSATRSFAGGMVDATTASLTLDFEVNLNDNNSAFVYKTLRQWCDIIYDPLTGRMGMKKDYIGGPMVVSWFNKQGDIFYQWKFATVFPETALSSPSTLDYNSNDAFKIEGFTLRADYWDETIL